jgi:hypothetical protein
MAALSPVELLLIIAWSATYTKIEPDNPTETPFYHDTFATGVYSEPAPTQAPGLPTNRKGEVSSVNWQFRVYLKAGKIDLWGLVYGYPKKETDTEAYTKYYSVDQPTKVSEENKTLKDWMHGIKLSQLSGTKDGLTITCQANIRKADGTEETQQFICGTIAK